TGAATAATIGAAATTSATAPATGDARFVVRGVVGGSRGNTGGEDFGLQRLMLHGVEVAGLRIAAGALPAGDHGAGGFVELASRLDVEAEAGEAALHVAALHLV